MDRRVFGASVLKGVLKGVLGLCGVSLAADGPDPEPLTARGTFLASHNVDRDGRVVRLAGGEETFSRHFRPGELGTLEVLKRIPAPPAGCRRMAVGLRQDPAQPLVWRWHTTDVEEWPAL